MQSMLRMGSSGPDVVTLQKALNEAGNSALAPLTPDGLFGLKSHSRVTEFQRNNGLMADGIAGPNTQNALQQYIDLVKGYVEKLVPPPGEEAARQRIVQTAEQFYNVHGWHTSDRVGANNTRIAANKCGDPMTRARQGGAVLATIFGMAGFTRTPPSRCLQISTTAESNYMNIGDKGRNEWDIPSWCGIFALNVYKVAGLRVSPWPIKYKKPGTVNPEFQSVNSGKNVKKGDFGVYQWNYRNHHFIVVGVNGDMITSIEGNVSQRFGNDIFQTIVKRNKFSINHIIYDKTSYFASPIWTEVI